MPVPLVDLRLTTIEPVDLRGAIYADDVQADYERMKARALELVGT